MTNRPEEEVHFVLEISCDRQSCMSFKSKKKRQKKSNFTTFFVLTRTYRIHDLNLYAFLKMYLLIITSVRDLNHSPVILNKHNIYAVEVYVDVRHVVWNLKVFFFQFFYYKNFFPFSHFVMTTHKWLTGTQIICLHIFPPVIDWK